MTALRESINKLIEETLVMEEQPKQSYPLTESQLQELLDPRLQTQPPLSEDENKEAMEVIQKSSPEKNLDFSQQPSENTPVEKSIVKRNRIKYTATRIKYSPELNLETFYQILVILELARLIFTMNLLFWTFTFYLLKT